MDELWHTISSRRMNLFAWNHTLTKSVHTDAAACDNMRDSFVIGCSDLAEMCSSSSMLCALPSNLENFICNKFRQLRRTNNLSLTHTNTRTCIHQRTHVHKERERERKRESMCTHACLHARTHAHKYTHKGTHTHTRISIHIHTLFPFPNFVYTKLYVNRERQREKICSEPNRYSDGRTLRKEESWDLENKGTLDLTVNGDGGTLRPEISPKSFILKETRAAGHESTTRSMAYESWFGFVYIGVPCMKLHFGSKKESKHNWI